MNREIKRLGGEGILNDRDIRDFSKVQLALIEYMADGEWYAATTIIEWSGQREGLRRLRDLRSRGFVVERKRDKTGREFYYRLTPKEAPAPVQLDLL